MRFFRWVASLFTKKNKPVDIDRVIKPTPQIDENDQAEERRDNIDTDKPDDGGDNVIYEIDNEALWYPKAIRSDYKLRTRGNYKHGYPKGCVLHATAGRSRTQLEGGGTRSSSTHKQRGNSSIRHAADKNSYCYFIVDRAGNVHQNFPLNRWGYHAGKSSWKGISGSVSDELVGIETQNAGKLKDYWTDGRGKRHDCPEGKFAAWFTRPDKGDGYFDSSEVRYSGKDENIQRGFYHKFSVEQEVAISELIIWLKANNPDVFDIDFALSHDEVSPTRKVDVGGSLSMTMKQFRNELKTEYKKRY